LIQARNGAESTMHGFSNDLKKYGDKVTPEEKTKAEDAVKAVETAIDGDDVEKINQSVKDLYEAIGPITKVKYEEEQKSKEDPVVDAEVKETATTV